MLRINLPDTEVAHKFDGLLTVGDSLSMPRPSNPATAQTPSECWPQLLREGVEPLWHWHLGIGGGTSSDVLRFVRNQMNYLSGTTDLLITVQFGIVDATPRQCPRWLARLVPMAESTIRWLGASKPLGQWRGLYKIWGRPWISPRVFELNVRNLARLAEKHGAIMLFSSVAEPGPRLLHLTGKTLVATYNALIEKVTREFPCSFMVRYEPELLPDGHHLTLSDHKLFAVTALENLLKHELWGSGKDDTAIR